MQVRKSLTLFALGALGAFAQTTTQPNAAPEQLSTTQFSCATSGSGPNFLKICVSKHGNLVSLQSPSGKEHIRVGKIVEGYSVCHFEDANAGEPTEYIDFGFEEFGWQEPFKVVQPGGPNTFPLTIHRKSNDGKVELVQTFGRNTTELEVSLTMTVFNRSGQTLKFLGIVRSIDFDVNGAAGNDIFLATPKSIVAWDSEDAHAASVTSFSPQAHAEIYPFPDWDFSGGGFCIPAVDLIPSSSPTEPGDHVGVLRHNFWTPSNFAPGTSRTVQFVYRIQ